ncbi:GntR family transcriptional regulator [Microbacterium sp. NPDC058345]|uniref:GntR family transcriptional regulator n=1 Tax=Microbacterium sp. NPDC058345 TaxID=3346455 RepID=UPI00365ADC95
MTNALRDDIMLGRRLPGARLIERDIAAELGVSRLPVREAIKALVGEGLAVKTPRTWAVVREFTIKDIRDFAEFREAIETLAWVLAAQRHDDHGAALMRATFARESRAVESGDIAGAQAASAQFHTMAVGLSGNDVLQELAESYVTRLRWLFGQFEEVVRMVDDHRVILDAFLARDVDALRELIPGHLAEGRDAAERRLRARTERSG